MTHITCESLAQNEYKRRLDKVAENPHKRCRKYGFEVIGAWYQNTLEKLMDGNGKAKIRWDFDFQIKKMLEHRRLL